MAYATYDFYKNSFRGNQIPETDFERLSDRASEYIDYITLGRAKTYNDNADAVKKACCSVADSISIQELSVGKSSESVGSWSVSYAAQTDMEAQKYNVAKKHLAFTGLLYCGMG